jgi:hypothetical protein
MKNNREIPQEQHNMVVEEQQDVVMEEIKE